MSLLVKNYYEKCITVRQDGQNFGSGWVEFEICICVTTLYLYHMKNALIFSQSATSNFSCILLGTLISLSLFTALLP